MAEGQSRKSLELQISNKTRNITLTYHRLDQEFHCSPYLNPELPPSLSDCCQVFSDPGSLDIEQLLVYEAESFTLAILVRVSYKPDDPSSAVQLELSQDKTHLRDLDQTLLRMWWTLDPPNPDKNVLSLCEFSNKSEGCVQLNAGPCRVTATMCHEPRSLLKIELDERELFVYDCENQKLPPCGII